MVILLVALVWCENWFSLGWQIQVEWNLVKIDGCRKIVGQLLVELQWRMDNTSSFIVVMISVCFYLGSICGRWGENCYVISTLVLILQELTCFSWYSMKVYFIKIQYFVKYQNTRFRDPMGIVKYGHVSWEIFGDRCIRAVYQHDGCKTHWPSFNEVWETYSYLSSGLGKQIIQMSLIIGFLEWLLSRCTF